MNRRSFVAGCFSTSLIASGAGAEGIAETEFYRQVEDQSGGRLGFAMKDLETGDTAHWQAQAAFPLSSTFKFLLAALILKLADQGSVSLARSIAINADDIVPWSPITERHIGAEMTLGDLCHATMTQSDNTAGNLLLAEVGGPIGFTRALRDYGDRYTRLDRFETELNQVGPNDPQDSTTPAAMLAHMEGFLLGERLSARSRQQLLQWMLDNQTGDDRIRAGLPPDWRVGDKTGTSRTGSVNDIAILIPPDRAPILLAVYFRDTTQPIARVNALHARIASHIASTR